MAIDKWVTCPRPNPRARLRLFCFPYAGGGASVYSRWVDSLPDVVEVCPVQLPGREGRLSEPPFTRLTPLVQAVASAMHPHLDKPFALFGHSMGATVVFELARFLRERAGLVPVCLFVSGRRAPQLPPQRSPIHHLPEEQFVEELLRFNGTPSMVLEHKELRELFLPILRADFAIHETYEYLAGEPFECPIFAFGGSEDELVDWKDLTAWEAQTKGPFSARLFVGDHFFLRSASEPVLQSITQALVSTLN